MIARLAPVLRLAVRSLMSRRLTAGLTILSVAISVTLFIGVEKIRQGARAGFERTISGTDLIVGARSGPVNLLLYSVFRIGSATNNITWETYQDVAARPEIAWTVPISLGDSHRGFRVVGTTPAFFERYQYGGGRPLAFAGGTPFDDLFDAVIGSDVARRLGYRVGQEIVLAHGIGAVSFAEHDTMPFRVSGILKPTGTPVDKAVHVSLAGIEAMHLGWQSGGQTPLARMMTPDRARAMTLEPKQITAFLVGLKSKIAVLRLRRDLNTYRQEPLLAIIPGVVLAELWSVVGMVETALSAIALFVIVVGLVGILTSILTTLNERRREMAILRSVGARPFDIAILMLSEAGLLAFAGSVLGLAVAYIGLFVAAPIIETRANLTLVGLTPSLFDVKLVAGITVAAIVLGVLPAWQAFSRSLQDGLSLRV
ncbi:MAG: ABC transporter permease [Alphaproteobacteria bacterium]